MWVLQKTGVTGYLIQNLDASFIKDDKDISSFSFLQAWLDDWMTFAEFVKLVSTMIWLQFYLSTKNEILDFVDIYI